MQAFRQSFREYGLAVAKWWWVLIVTGALEVLGLISFFKPGMNKMPEWALWVIPFIGVSIAQFLAFHDVRVKRDQIAAERDELKQIKSYEDALDTLSVYFAEGNNEIFNRNIPDAVEYGRWKADWNAWEDKVADHIQTNFGLSERNLFKNNVMFDQIKIGSPVADDQELNFGILYNQLKTIREIIVRHSDKVQTWRAANI